MLTTREVPGLDGHPGGIFPPSAHLKKREAAGKKGGEIRSQVNYLLTEFYSLASRVLLIYSHVMYQFIQGQESGGSVGKSTLVWYEQTLNLVLDSP